MTNCANCGARTEIDPANGVLVCRHCGSVAEAPALTRLQLGSDSPAMCPACATPMANATLEGHPLLACRGCGGLLIAMPLFVPIIDAARAHEDRTGVIAPRQQRPGDRVLACPRCQQPMLSHLYGGPGNLVIDTCEPCQVNWLDPAELRRIARAP
jgi:DNA-directed RNA polymerase subunit RPC12/RpoP